MCNVCITLLCMSRAFERRVLRTAEEFALELVRRANDPTHRQSSALAGYLNEWIQSYSLSFDTLRGINFLLQSWRPLFLIGGLSGTNDDAPMFPPGSYLDTPPIEGISLDPEPTFTNVRLRS